MWRLRRWSTSCASPNPPTTARAFRRCGAHSNSHGAAAHTRTRSRLSCRPCRLKARGWCPKTIHLLDYCNDPVYRRAILGQINRGEGRHELARRVCHGNKGSFPSAIAKAKKNSSARSGWS